MLALSSAARKSASGLDRRVPALPSQLRRPRSQDNTCSHGYILVEIGGVVLPSVLADAKYVERLMAHSPGFQIGCLSDAVS
jgi:hypothetical protein